jgi:hypothetical protein
MRNRSAGMAEPGAGYSREYYNSILQKVGELSHHDTITGTSPGAVIRDETA